MDIFNDFNITRYEGRLKNNIKIVLFYKSGAPITTTAILKSGSKYDPERMYGLAHCLEHMILNGSVKFPSKDLLAEHIESVGGSLGAATWQEYMRVNVEVPDKSDYFRVVDIFDATLCNPLMTKESFENEKQVILKEIYKSNSNQVRVLYNAVRKKSFKGTSFEHEILGDEESISKLIYDDMLLGHKKLFDKSRITFVVSGDISLSELQNQLNTLSFLEGNNFSENKEKLDVENEQKISYTFFDAPQTSLYLGVYGPQLFTKESAHINILGQIVARPRTYRLTKRLRYKKGLVYDVSFSIFGGINIGTWGIFTNTSEAKVQEVINEIIEEVRDIQKNGVKESELEFVKDFMIKSLRRTMQTSNDWVNFHAYPEAFSIEGYDINTFVKYIKEATVNDIKQIVDKYLSIEKLQLTLTGRTKEGSIVFRN